MKRLNGVGVVTTLLLCTTAMANDLWTEGQQRVHRERSLLSKVAVEALPAVVAITTEHDDPSSEEGLQNGFGAGFIIHSSGYLITGHHVIEGAKRILIQLGDSSVEPMEATVVGIDERTDLALLKVDAKSPLPVLSLGHSSDLEIGDWMVAVGNPFGLSHSVSVGVLSSTGRTDVLPTGRYEMVELLQTDASINPGSSGGPLLDLQGRVVAMANSVNVSGQGIAFAVPIDLIKEVLPQLHRHGKVQRGWIGISVEELPPIKASTGGSNNAARLRVSQVEPNSPAAKAGLLPGDLITEVGTHRVRKLHRLKWKVGMTGPGQSVWLGIRRGQRNKRIRVKLAEAPANKRVDEEPSFANADYPSRPSKHEHGAP